MPPRRQPARSRSLLPDQLRAAIVRSGLSNADLADQAGVAASSISRFLRAGQDLGLTSAGRIAEALGLELAEARGPRPARRLRVVTPEPAEAEPAA